MSDESSEIPHGMKRIYRRFTHWRSAHPGVRRPIPQRLWKAAAKVAVEQGVCRTAQILRLEYGKLKRMAESEGVPVAVDSRKGRGMQRSTASPAAGQGSHEEGPPHSIGGFASVIHGAGGVASVAVGRSV